MTKYYCDYCDVYLSHDSPSVRKSHVYGKKHKEKVLLYYQAWYAEQVQKLIDETTAKFKARNAVQPYGIVPRPLPPGHRPMTSPFEMPPGMGSMMMGPLGSMQPMMVPHGSMPQMMGPHGSMHVMEMQPGLPVMGPMQPPMIAGPETMP